MESATLTESILQMSCLSGQLCQVCCGWGQGQPGRSSEVRAPSGSGTAPSVQSQMKAGSLRLSLSFYGSSCDFTYSADNKWRLVSFSHSKPKVCLKLENVLKYIGSKNLADWDTIFAVGNLYRHQSKHQTLANAVFNLSNVKHYLIQVILHSVSHNVS